MFAHILVPTDGSRASLRAAQAAVDLARLAGGRITGFFAAPPATPIVFGDFLPKGYMTPDEHTEIIGRMAAKHLGAIEKTAAAAGVPFDAAHSTSDFPADAILQIAEQRKCDLIVIAPHSKSSLAEFFLGSQSQKVVARAKIPVLVFR